MILPRTLRCIAAPAVALLLAAGACRTPPYPDPEPVAAHPDVAKTELAIEKAMAARGWSVAERSDRRIVAKALVRGDLTTFIEITWDASQVKIHRLDEVYRDDRTNESGRAGRAPRDMPAYVRWPDDLLAAIATEISYLQR